MLDIARDVWTNGDAAEKQLRMPTVQYLEKLRSDLEIAREAAKANISEAHDKSKAHYDKHSTERELQPGESVLILLPTDGRKLTAQWRGPHKVLRRLPNNNYEIQIENRRATLHINSLRKFVESSITTDDQTQTVSMIISEDDETAGDLITPDGDSEAGPESVTIGAQLTPAQRNAVNDLLSEYADVFTTDPGHTNLVEHVIEVTDEDPVFQPSYKVPDALRDQVERELNRMVQKGIIERDPNTAYNSPMLVVRKKDNKNIRIVNNFIALNRKTKDVKCNMPNANELLNRVAGGIWLTKIDLASCYWQIPLKESCKKYTGFWSPIGRFVYKRTAMGLKTASNTCQKLVDILLTGAHKYAGSLMDDILVYDKNFEDHLTHVRDVLDRIRRAGLTANPKKCSIAADRIEVLGHTVIKGKIYPNEQKVQAIKDWPTPCTKNS